MKKWTNEETETLKNKYPIKSFKELCDLIPDRTPSSIVTKACRLKLSFGRYGLNSKQRFWKHVDKKSDNECWNWTGSCVTGGYGQIRTNKGTVGSHRFSYELHFGKIPNKMWICHICDNPSCVNPKHLWLGTPQDDANDRIKKDKQAKFENNGMAKLTWNQVKQIRELENKLTQKEIAELVFKDNASMTRMINTMVQKKYLKRSMNSEDRRRYKIEITVKGRQVLETLPPIIQNNRKTSLKGITKNELNQLEIILNKIRSNCK